MAPYPYFDLRIPCSPPRLAGAYRPATSGDCPAATASRSAAAFIPRPAPVGVALPDLAAGHRRDGVGQPATVVQSHRKGFRLYWRWRSRSPGRPRVSTGIRDLIRCMSKANPLWGAPRIHGELLKLGIRISQATVGRCMPWRGSRVLDACRSSGQFPARPKRSSSSYVLTFLCGKQIGDAHQDTHIGTRPQARSF
jgi:hypothetical protein